MIWFYHHHTIQYCKKKCWPPKLVMDHIHLYRNYISFDLLISLVNLTQKLYIKLYTYSIYKIQLPYRFIHFHMIMENMDVVHWWFTKIFFVHHKLCVFWTFSINCHSRWFKNKKKSTIEIWNCSNCTKSQYGTEKLLDMISLLIQKDSWDQSMKKLTTSITNQHHTFRL